MYRNLLRSVVAAVLFGGGLTILTPAAGAAPLPKDPWQWLQNTYWYVPHQYLLALASSPSSPSPIPVSDQTVYYIAGYSGGYFWGTTAVSYQRLRASEATTPSCLQLVGSVTPEGAVHLTFTSLSAGAAGSAPTVGLGTMTPVQYAWTMENQMSTTAVGDLLLTHWAYMYQCRRGQPCFSQLPGVATSIPQFLKPCLQSGIAR